MTCRRQCREDDDADNRNVCYGECRDTRKSDLATCDVSS